MAYSWPGNVREFRNVMERALILSKSEWIETAHLPPYLRNPGSESSTKIVLPLGITAAEAERIGLINRVVPADQLLSTAMAFAARLANGPTKAIRWTKVSVNKILRDTANLVLDTSLALEKQCFSTADHKEAIRAFVEKREPKFTGR